MSEPEEEGYIVEYMRIGGVIKVTAIDTATMREVSIVGSPKVSSKELAKLAVRKLQYVLKRDNPS